MSNIGFIAGCINKQPGIARKDLYHHVLSRKLDEAGNSSIKLLFGQYPAYNTLVERVDSFIAQKAIQYMFLFLRPYPLPVLFKPLIKYKDEDGSIKRALHPALFNKKSMTWQPYLSNFTLDDAVLNKAVSRFGLREVNLITGMILGVDKWAVAYLKKQLADVKAICKSRGVKLKILSIPGNPGSVAGHYLCKFANRQLSKECDGNTWIDLGDVARDCFNIDGLHYSEKGHGFLADVLFQELMAL